jgi:hypothetical protein
MSVEMDAAGLHILHDWRHPAGLVVVPFSLIWAGMLYWLISSDVGRGDLVLGTLIPVMHSVFGLGMAYMLLTKLFNHSRITVTADRVQVSHGPLPWPGACSILTSHIDQLFCKEIRRTTNHGLSLRYEVWADMTDGTQSRLVHVGLSAEQALFIEQQLEKALGIQDREMPGELPR